MPAREKVYKTAQVAPALETTPVIVSPYNKAVFMKKFRSPRRRLTRQRSGFKVAGDERGSTCKILNTFRLYPEEGRIEIRSQIQEVLTPVLFKRNLGIVGVGFYFKPSGYCKVEGTVAWTIREETLSDFIPSLETKTKIWYKHGHLLFIPLTKETTVNDIDVRLKFETSSSVDFFGLMIGAIKQPYLQANDVYTAFQDKTAIYIPEILYIDPTTQSAKFSLAKGRLTSSGSPVVCKSCNRCSRFLPIDISYERNTLSYSNHCVSRAPCVHSSFARYIVKEGTTKLLGKKDETYVHTHYGHQLECKVCKKFFVNLPLNPLRNSTQHREDGLRRRALEVLVNELLDRKWAYHFYRETEGKELDVAIWEKFGRRCFNCGAVLKDPRKGMHLDHTLPLAYLWPLDETATCLCGTCNNSKHDKFPIEFYPKEKLPALAKLTGIPIGILNTRLVNGTAAKELINKVVWFFEDFLSRQDYQKIRKGKKVADILLHSLQNVLRINLVDLYYRKKGEMPKSVTIN